MDKVRTLIAALLISAGLSNAEWIYRQYDEAKMVSFSHQPVATLSMLQRAKTALEKVNGVEEVYIKDHSLVVLKESKCSWDDIWPTIANTLATIGNTTTSAYLASR